MLIEFTNRLFGLGGPCCAQEQIGLFYLVTCTVTGAEMIWSPNEDGTLGAAWEEHNKAHDTLFDRQAFAREAALQRAVAHQIYRTTEPGDPARRGIGAYL